MFQYPQGNFKAKKATLYHSTGFGNVAKVEVREVEVVRRPYAQDEGAVFATYLRPRKRKLEQYTGSYKPYLVVLEGWGHPEPADMFNWSISESGALVGTGRHSACSGGYENEFDAQLASYLETNPKVEVLGDYRHTQGCNTHDASASEEYLAAQKKSVADQLEAAGVPHEVAVEAGENFVEHSPYWAAGVLCNEHDVMCTADGLSITLINGPRVEPPRYGL